jgi:hypothetical protein
MKPTLLTALALLSAALTARAADDRNWKFDEHESVSKSFDIPASAGPRRLLVDNISGFIHVTGSAGNQVRISVDRETRAFSQQAADEAKRDVKLDMSQQGNFVRLYADGPFRGSNGTNYRGDDYYGYRVIFDFEIEVPADTEVVLKNLNSPIELKKTTGDYDIHGLNGKIDVQEVSGSGTIQTLNGSVKVAFSRNPQRETHFKTLNGSIDVYFQPPLDADLHFKKLNGEVYTDFDVTTLPIQPGSMQNLNGKFIYRSDRSMAGRAGKGGPELDFETLNGSIRLRSKAL